MKDEASESGSSGDDDDSAGSDRDDVQSSESSDDEDCATSVPSRHVEAADQITEPSGEGEVETDEKADVEAADQTTEPFGEGNEETDEKTIPDSVLFDYTLPTDVSYLWWWWCMC